MKFGDFRQRDKECLHHLYWYAMSACSVPTPHTVQVWSIVYRCQGHAKCPLLDKRTSPHFLYFILIPLQEVRRKQTLSVMKRLLVLLSLCLLCSCSAHLYNTNNHRWCYSIVLRHSVGCCYYSWIKTNRWFYLWTMDIHPRRKPSAWCCNFGEFSGTGAYTSNDIGFYLCM